MGVLMIATAISSFMLLQQKMSIETGLSTKAYQAADTGAEWILFQINKKGNDTVAKIQGDFDNSGLTFLCSQGGILIDGCSYCFIIPDPEEVGGKISAINSIGKCGQVERAIEITF